MRLGLDFDNTLAAYDLVFSSLAVRRELISTDWSGTKNDLRDLVRSQPGGEIEWQKLQGQAYGQAMHQADLMPGAMWFLYRCKARAIPVNIISHKTEFGHYDKERVPLREEAIKWMENREFFDSLAFGLSRNHVWFESSREDKVHRIGKLGLTVFVDDLPEVFFEPHFPNNVVKVLYAPEGNVEDVPEDVIQCKNWFDIGEAILGPEAPEELLFIAKRIMNDLTVTSCIEADGGGNSRVYRLETSSGELAALKRYPFNSYDKRDRLGTEYRACLFLRRHGINQVPAPKLQNRDALVGVFDWVPGERPLTLGTKDLEQAVSFIQSVDNSRLRRGSSELSLASEACLSGYELCRQIDTRRAKLGEIVEAQQDFGEFLINDFDPLWAKIRLFMHHNWPGELEFCDDLDFQYQTLSMSDFGFHNALRGADGSLRFVDLEYFGWDDPVKLASDFWWHPGMEMGEALKDMWIFGTTAVFSRDPCFISRLNAVHPAYGMRWALIVLNGALTDYNCNNSRRRILQGQLEKSKSLCAQALDWIEHDRRFDLAGSGSGLEETRVTSGR